MKRKRGPSWKKVTLIALNCVLGIMLLALVIGTVFVEVRLGGLQYDPNDRGTLSDAEKEAIQNDMQGSTLDPDANVEGRDEIDLELPSLIDIDHNHVFNFLLVGQDRLPGEKRARSDSMILVTVNTESKTITMTSIMRDMYVKIPGYRDNRINVAYNLDGIELLYKTIETNFGLRLDQFVEVDFNGFEKVIDLVGGVDIELTEQEARHLNNNEDYYGFPQESWNLKPGMNHLNGKQALAHSRNRSVDGTGDFSRTNRQRTVMTSLIEKIKTLSWGQLYNLLMIVTDPDDRMITTDMSSNDILAYAYTFYSMLDEMQIVNQRIPIDGSYRFASVENVGEVLIPDLKKNRDFLLLTQQ